MLVIYLCWCTYALDKNPNLFPKSFSLCIYLFLLSYFSLVYKVFFKNFPCILFKPTDEKNYFLVVFFSRWHFGMCLPNTLAAGGEF
jgi:hypothetical protein